MELQFWTIFRQYGTREMEVEGVRWEGCLSLVSLCLGAFEVSWQHLGDCLHRRNCIAVVLLWERSYINCVLCLYDAFRLLKMSKACRARDAVLTLRTPWSLLSRWLLCSWNTPRCVHPGGAVFTSQNQLIEIEGELTVIRGLYFFLFGRFLTHSGLFWWLFLGAS